MKDIKFTLIEIVGEKIIVLILFFKIMHELFKVHNKELLIDEWKKLIIELGQYLL